MAQTNTELSVEIIARISETLNHLIRTEGEIQINNKTIWDNILHRMDNSVWRGILETLHRLYNQHPNLYRNYHIEAIEEGLSLLDRYDQYYDSVLDIRTRHLDHKKCAWRCLMSMREIYCAALDINLPNSNAGKIQNEFGNLFNAD